MALNQNDLTHPAQLEVDHYEEKFSGSLGDYYNWEKTTNGVSARVNEYATTHLTNSATSWINAQNQPWFLWLAYLAPHSPFHVPPSDLYTTPATNNLTQYIAMIEAIDSEIGRLLENIPPDVLANT